MPHSIVVAGRITFWFIVLTMINVVLAFLASALYNLPVNY